MKTITIYELLGMVKDGDVPLKFKVNDEIYEYDEDRGYICRHIGGWTYLYENLNKGYISLNDEVEILEEEKKIPEKEDELIRYNIQEFDNLKEFVEITTNDVFGKINKIINNQNKIIDYLDYLKSKGDE